MRYFIEIHIYKKVHSQLDMKKWNKRNKKAVSQCSEEHWPTAKLIIKINLWNENEMKWNILELIDMMMSPQSSINVAWKLMKKLRVFGLYDWLNLIHKRSLITKSENYFLRMSIKMWRSLRTELQNEICKWKC